MLSGEATIQSKEEVMIQQYWAISCQSLETPNAVVQEEPWTIFGSEQQARTAFRELLEAKRLDGAIIKSVRGLHQQTDARVKILDAAYCIHLDSERTGVCLLKLIQVAQTWAYVPPSVGEGQGNEPTQPLAVSEACTPPAVHASKPGQASDYEPCPFHFPKHPGFLNLRDRWRNVLREGEPVVILEKIHGLYARFVYKDGRLWVGSRRQVVRESDNSVYWQIAWEYAIDWLLQNNPDIAIYGIIYGDVGLPARYCRSHGEAKLVITDAMYLSTRKYMDFRDMHKFVTHELGFGICVPRILYEGPWSEDLRKLAKGRTYTGAGHLREGIIIRPEKERYDKRCGRVNFKLLTDNHLWYKTPHLRGVDD
jgi:hypothetical protein